MRSLSGLRWVAGFLRLASIVLVAMLATSALVFYAPGYFSEAGEVDANHAGSARVLAEQRRSSQASLSIILRQQLQEWSRGDLGHSRQFDVPVSSLLRERATLSLALLCKGIGLGWLSATAAALLVVWPHSSRLHLASAFTSSALLGLPVGALATLCLVGDLNAPAIVLAAIIGVRDFKLQQRALEAALASPHILHARAQGLAPGAILLTHILPVLRGEWLNILLASLTLALSALVPVEVIFDLPGLGQLAWSAAINRDLPVLVTLTAIMAGCIGVATALVRPAEASASLPCAQ